MRQKIRAIFRLFSRRLFAEQACIHWRVVLITGNSWVKRLRRMKILVKWVRWGTCDRNRCQGGWEISYRKTLADLFCPCSAVVTHCGWSAFHCFWISRVLLLRSLFNRVPFRTALSEVKSYLLKILAAWQTLPSKLYSKELCTFDTAFSSTKTAEIYSQHWEVFLSNLFVHKTWSCYSHSRKIISVNTPVKLG